MNTTSKIEDAEVIGETIEKVQLQINTMLYLIAIIIMLLAYLGPYVYFKFYKKRNFIPTTNIGTKHSIK